MRSQEVTSAERLQRLVRVWAKRVEEWTSYRTPPGQSAADHFIPTLFYRIVVLLFVQGVLLIVVGGAVAARLRMLGAAYLLIGGFSLAVQKRLGARAGWRAGHFLSAVGLIPYIAISGGIYSHAVSSLVMLWISSSFAFEISVTAAALTVQLGLLGIMAALQSHNLWLHRLVTPTPALAWLFTAQMTLNFAIPIITTIQAYREALDKLQLNVGELRTAEEETRKLMEAQRRFFWDISHELRSPLTRLNLSVGKARREAPASAEPSLERMENEVDRLNHLLHQLLLLAQLKQGVLFPMNERLDLAAVVMDVCQDAEFEANVAGRDLRFDCDELWNDCSCRVQGCTELLRSAVENVVRNAIRFAPEGSSVEVSISRPSRKVIAILIADRGPGVPESQISMLFDPFFRVIPDALLVVPRVGSGLGLAIASEAMKKHGGSVRAENRPGGGLAVRMEIAHCLEDTESSDTEDNVHDRNPSKSRA